MDCVCQEEITSIIFFQSYMFLSWQGLKAGWKELGLLSKNGLLSWSEKHKVMGGGHFIDVKSL